MSFLLWSSIVDTLALVPTRHVAHRNLAILLLAGVFAARRPFREGDPRGAGSQGGFWFDRSQEYVARNRGEDFGRLKYAEEEELVLSQLPCWAVLSAEQYREQVAGLIEEIEAEARVDREARGIEPMGVEEILRQDPHSLPSHTKKSPAPAVHAASKAARQAFWEAYSTFLAAFREAAEKLKGGDRTARFPLGSFPPALPFVSAYPSLPP